MIGDIRKHMEGSEFSPFTIHMADGKHFRVPTREHILVVGMRAIVANDAEDYDVLPGLLMSGLTVDASSAAAGRS